MSARTAAVPKRAKLVEEAEASDQERTDVTERQQQEMHQIIFYDLWREPRTTSKALY